MATALAILLFAAPLAIWLGYSERIASAGGLTAFLEAAAGRRIARLQALVWTVSYGLYLPYTVTFVVYDILAVVLPGLKPYRTALELALPVALSALVLAPVAWALRALLGIAIVQLGVMLVLGAVTLAHVGAPGGSFAPHTDAAGLGKGTGGISLLFVCASLPLFFGGEVRGGTRTIRTGILAGFCIAAAYVLFTVFPLAAVPNGLRTADIPGMAIAQAYSGRPLAVAVGLATAASVTALIVAEFLALGRLAYHVLGVNVRRALAIIAGPFLAVDAISLLNPERFYRDLLRPSLIALFIAQLPVVALYPRYRRRTGQALRAGHAVLAVAASGLMVYGLYTAVTNTGGT